MLPDPVYRVDSPFEKQNPDWNLRGRRKESIMSIT
jgi:hypothetical protein